HALVPVHGQIGHVELGEPGQIGAQIRGPDRSSGIAAAAGAAAAVGARVALERGVVVEPGSGGRVRSRAERLELELAQPLEGRAAAVLAGRAAADGATLARVGLERPGLPGAPRLLAGLRLRVRG